MKFVLRVDDIAWESNPKPDHGLHLAKRFHAAMQGLPYLAAVIPAAIDPEGLAWLQSNPPGMTVALHGWSHAYSNSGVASEFHDCDFDQCRLRVSAGRNALPGIEIAHMVLPFNAYAPPLGEACYLEGVHWIWGGGAHDSTTPSAWPTPPQPYSIGRVGFVPSWARTYGATLWMMSAECDGLHKTLPKLLDHPGKAVLTLHITWEAAKCSDFDGIKWLVDLIGNRVITVGEYLS